VLVVEANFSLFKTIAKHHTFFSCLLGAVHSTRRPCGDLIDFIHVYQGAHLAAVTTWKALE
jgi:hypothetical protein